MDIVLHPLESYHLISHTQIKCSTLFSWCEISGYTRKWNVVDLLTFLALGESQRSKPIIEIYIYERRALRGISNWYDKWRKSLTRETLCATMLVALYKDDAPASNPPPYLNGNEGLRIIELLLAYVQNNFKCEISWAKDRVQMGPRQRTTGKFGPGFNPEGR
jgi:hypothetical protein